MGLLPAENAPEVSALKRETLDELWHEAEGLGRVEVDSDYRGEVYSASIKFDRKSGTRIYAKGTDSSIHVAMAKAINEAREMGAG